MKKRLFALCVCIVYIGISCKQDIYVEYKPIKITTATIEMCSVQDCPDIKIVYPLFQQPIALANSVNNWTTAQLISRLDPNGPNASLKEHIEWYINSAQTAYPETIVYSDAHEFTVTIAVSFVSSDVLSLVYHDYEFNGGASGYERLYYVNFNPRNGEFFENSEILDTRFYAFAKAEFETTYPSRPFEIDEHMFSNGSDNSIGFSKEGLIINYKDHHHIPTSEEQYTITIPWQDVEDYLTF